MLTACGGGDNNKKGGDDVDFLSLDMFHNQAKSALLAHGADMTNRTSASMNDYDTTYGGVNFAFSVMNQANAQSEPTICKFVGKSVYITSYYDYDGDKGIEEHLALWNKTESEVEFWASLYENDFEWTQEEYDDFSLPQGVYWLYALTFGDLYKVAETTSEHIKYEPKSKATYDAMLEEYFGAGMSGFFLANSSVVKIDKSGVMTWDVDINQNGNADHLTFKVTLGGQVLPDIFA